MKEFWESIFNSEGALWKFEPADSAALVMDLFKSHHIKSILIPGVGYGRNAKLFYENGFKLTGIEISRSAIEIAKENGLNYKIHHGSVVSMPFDNEKFEGVFCYALVHLLNKPQRRKFLGNCYKQLSGGGIMVFTVASKRMSMFAGGRKISTDRYRLSNGLKVYFYDSDSVVKEFSDFGLSEYKEIEEPVKFMEGQEPVKMILVICKK
jgi:SAM-dependent methyltransferase